MSLPPPPSSHPLNARTLLLAVPPAALLTFALAVAISGLNEAGFLAANRAARILPDPAWAWITVIGEGACAIALVAPALHRHPRLIAAALITAVLAGLFTHSVKPLFEAARPAAVLALDQFHIVGAVLSRNAFPSGHSVTAFALAGVLVAYLPRPGRAAAILVPVAALVAFSRIAVGAHWPLDVLVGAAGGWLSGWAGEALSRRWAVWPGLRWRIAFGLALLGLGIGLALADLGYPDALPLQWALAVLAAGSGLYAGWQALRAPR